MKVGFSDATCSAFFHIMLCFLQCCLSFTTEKLHLEIFTAISVQDSNRLSKSEETSNPYISAKYLKFIFRYSALLIISTQSWVLSSGGKKKRCPRSRWMSDPRNDNPSVNPAFSMLKRKCCDRLCPLVKTGPHYFIKTSVINQNFLSQLYLLAFLLPVFAYSPFASPWN